jgi:hypothetical protein
MKNILLVFLLTRGLFNVQAQVANQADDIYACDIDNDGFEAFDLTQNNVAIFGGQSTGDYTLTYHQTQADADLGVNAIVNPENYINTSNPQSIFARLERISDGNFDTTDFALIVFPAPVVQTPFPLEVCDDNGDGFAEFDLTLKDVEIINGDPDLFVSYHGTLNHAEQGILPLSIPYINETPFFHTVYARVESASNSCWTTVELDLIVYVECPVIDLQPLDLFIDEGDDNGLAEFNLTQNESLMLGSQDPALYLFSYFLSEENSIRDENAISTPENFQNTSNPQLIYVRFYNNDTGGYVLTNFEIETDGVLGSEDVFSNNFSVYPNPAASRVVIQSNAVFPNLEITLFDMNGRLLFAESNVAGSNRLQLDVSNLASGMYLLQINSEEKTTVKQLVKR